MSKHIPIKDVGIAEQVADVLDVAGENAQEDLETFSGDAVSTDLVITNPSTDRAAIIPLKITTRERIVQPFAHQRIVDSAFPGRYASFIACISEVQRDDKTQTVKQVCVPGTVALFQKHLAKIQGLYYCDIPVRYAAADFQQVLPVQSFHKLLEDVSTHLGRSA
ncbi:MAG: hypothetical protein NVV62_01965 [Terricaulis sp.]|nr:hypothetical protein [Terricaulis sp.]